MSYPQQGQGQQHPQQQQQAYQGGYAPAPAQQQAPTARGAGQNMKRRNPIGAWLGLPIITFGIYGLVWFFKVHNELHEYDRRIDNAAVNALLSLLFGSITFGIWPLIMWVKLAGRIAQAQRAAASSPAAAAAWASCSASSASASCTTSSSSTRSPTATATPPRASRSPWSRDLWRCSPPSGLAALHRRETRAIAGIAPARLAARFAIRFSLRLNPPSDAIAAVEVVGG
ncbi:DUF4234 domain-containing protein [Actinomadura madurae]|uniref:DUF4234 domain-containing protein n=1 Tax=Actinomadura madurae TaxID=1993 RepID=UPI0020D1FB52|nr:DUF4234 domain-containing protein [Actinomadura madurae]MCQ0010323.1 DUF4234 domain-containing protein [Actinomadura madurae]